MDDPIERLVIKAKKSLKRDIKTKAAMFDSTMEEVSRALLYESLARGDNYIKKAIDKHREEG